jgi:hypothetical protein
MLDAHSEVQSIEGSQDEMNPLPVIVSTPMSVVRGVLRGSVPACAEGAPVISENIVGRFYLIVVRRLSIVFLKCREYG